MADTKDALINKENKNNFFINALFKNINIKLEHKVGVFCGDVKKIWQKRL
jgi:hypothetical protein